MMLKPSSCPAILSVLLLSIISLRCIDMEKESQYHHSSNSKLEESLVTTSKTKSYVPVSALCAESTLEKLRFKLNTLYFGCHLEWCILKMYIDIVQ